MKPIILLHGALGTKTQLEPLKDLLKQSGRDVHTLNFSGHSGEPFSSSGFGIEVFSNDVLEYIQRERLDQVDIFGYSMGGYVAIWLALQHPTIVNQVTTLGTKFDWTPETAIKEVNKLDPEKIELKVPAFARILKHRHAPADWKELVYKTAIMMTQLGNSPLLTKAMFQSIKHFTTILLGDEDEMADTSYSKQVSAWVPQSRFSILSKTPHPIEKVNLHQLLPFILN